MKYYIIEVKEFEKGSTTPISRYYVIDEDGNKVSIIFNDLDQAIAKLQELEYCEISINVPR